MYKGEAQVSKEQLLSLYEAIDKLMIKGKLNQLTTKILIFKI